MRTHTLHVVGGEDGETVDLTEVENADDCTLICDCRGRRIETTADDFFQALCDIRLQLEKDGLLLFCYGASLNVYPSTMARQMSSGRSAYRMTMGRQAVQADLIPIFDDGPDVIPSSVEQQESFFQGWLRSLG